MATKQKAAAAESKAGDGPSQNKAGGPRESAQDKEQRLAREAASVTNDPERGNAHREALESAEFKAATEDARKAAEKRDADAAARSGADYGEADRAVLQASGYRLTDEHFEVPKAIERQKDTSTEVGQKGMQRDED